MKNTFATSIMGLLIAIALAIEGATTHGPTLNLLHFPLLVLVAIYTAAMTALATYETGKQTLRDLRVALEAARSEARAFAMLARDILKPIFGTVYSEAWNVVGFVDSLEVASNVDELIFLLERIVAFFTANPTLEIASRNITAAHAQIVLDGLKNARKAVNDQETVVENLKTVRDEKLDAVRAALRGLFDELSNQLDPLDPRWKAFGFNMPGADETPDVPENLSAILIGPTAAAMKWGASARAGHYRVWQRVIGVDAEPVAVGSPADIDFNLENLPAASTVEIYVSAVNNGGESQLSEKITIVTH
ncbi:MAG: hypothetical protein JWM68_783 [Verrucomicrobiales bacterium]|nr:hypothetical protein [Verrucomicrobiales bacterium]